MQQTNWIVITGAPCSGKTSVICALEKKGYSVVHEVARALIDKALQQGLSLAEIKSDESAFEYRILEEKEKIEAGLSPTALIFLDRAIPDSLAYFIHAGLDPDLPLKKSRLYHYKKIFLFERFRFKRDKVRIEDEIIAEKLDRLLWESYQLLKYDVIRVPVLPVAERTEYILSRIQ